jgi:Flp pilus assembly protein TadB
MRQSGIFNWRMVLRYVAYGAVPLLLVFVVAEWLLGRVGVGAFFVMLSLLLPFLALAWLGYQNFRKR